MPIDFAALPAPPIPPDPLECCGSGCVPCILDYYDLQLQAWENKHQCTLREYQLATQNTIPSSSEKPHD